MCLSKARSAHFCSCWCTSWDSRLTGSIETTDTPIHTVRARLDLAHLLAVTATVPAVHLAVARLPVAARPPGAVWLPQIHTLQAGAHRVHEAGHLRFEGDLEARDETTTGAQGLGLRLVGGFHRDGTISEVIEHVRRAEMHTTRTLVLHDHARGLRLRESAIPHQLEVVVCARRRVQVGTKNRAPESAGWSHHQHAQAQTLLTFKALPAGIRLRVTTATTVVAHLRRGAIALIRLLRTLGGVAAPHL